MNDKKIINNNHQAGKLITKIIVHMCHINDPIIDSTTHYDSFYESLINLFAKF